jgi:hypothetical protein
MKELTLEYLTVKKQYRNYRISFNKHSNYRRHKEKAVRNHQKSPLSPVP